MCDDQPPLPPTCRGPEPWVDPWPEPEPWRVSWAPMWFAVGVLLVLALGTLMITLV